MSRARGLLAGLTRRDEERAAVGKAASRSTLPPTFGQKWLGTRWAKSGALMKVRAYCAEGRNHVSIAATHAEYGQ